MKLTLLLCIIFLFVPMDANAQALEETICKIVGLAQSDIGKPLATAGVLALALMAIFGRVSWGPLMVTTAGIGIIFSASDIVEAATDLSPSCSGAGMSGAIKEKLCALLEFAQSGTAKAASTGAVLILGVMAILGRIQWGQAVMFAAAIGGVNGAAELASGISVGTGAGTSMGAGEFCGV